MTAALPSTASSASTATTNARDTALETVGHNPANSDAYVDLACLLTAGEVVTLPDGRRMDDLELCKEAIRLDPANGRAYAHLAGSVCMGGSVVLANGRRMTQRKLYLETLRHDPTNGAAYDYLAMMADEADPIEYFGQVAALAAAEEAREGMQAPLPPLWPRVLHLLADLKLPPDSVPGALIRLPAVLRALRSSDEQLHAGGLGAMIRFTKNRSRAAEVPRDAITWLGRVLWCSAITPSLIRAVMVIRHLANLPSYVAPLLHASPPVVPSLVALIASEDGELAELAISALASLARLGDTSARSELMALGVLEAMEGYLESTTADPSSLAIGMAARCASALYEGAPYLRVASFVSVLARRLSALANSTSPDRSQTATALFASIWNVVFHRLKGDGTAILDNVQQRELLSIVQPFTTSTDETLAWYARAMMGHFANE
jgi:hypothetical protein